MVNLVSLIELRCEQEKRVLCDSGACYHCRDVYSSMQFTVYGGFLSPFHCRRNCTDRELTPLPYNFLPVFSCRNFNTQNVYLIAEEYERENVSSQCKAPMTNCMCSATSKYIPTSLFIETQSSFYVIVMGTCFYNF